MAASLAKLFGKGFGGSITKKRKTKKCKCKKKK